MYQLLIKLMLISAFLQFGLRLKDFNECRSRQCIKHIDQASRDVLKIKWKPISIWPEEAKRFQ